MSVGARRAIYDVGACFLGIWLSAAGRTMVVRCRSPRHIGLHCPPLLSTCTRIGMGTPRHVVRRLSDQADYIAIDEWTCGGGQR
ncbi:hypothetical protein BJ912DRAFT_991570 [Pholiota molesta]|nr:hypothetical protein BJ912DRAFT_991570 [Pholiota molesta]